MSNARGVLRRITPTVKASSEHLFAYQNRVGHYARPSQAEERDMIERDSDFLKRIYSLIFPSVEENDIVVENVWLFINQYHRQSATCKFERFLMSLIHIEDYETGKLSDGIRRKIYAYIIDNALDVESYLGAEEQRFLHKFQNERGGRDIISEQIETIKNLNMLTDISMLSGLWKNIFILIRRLYPEEDFPDILAKYWGNEDSDTLNCYIRILGANPFVGY